MSHYTVGNIHGTLSFYAKELSKKIIKSRNEDEIEYIMVKNISYIIVIIIQRRKLRMAPRPSSVVIISSVNIHEKHQTRNNRKILEMQ